MHVWQRGVDRAACFREPEDRTFYLGLLEEFSVESKCAIHGYVLMTNHVHLLLTPCTDAGCSRFMKDVSQRYSQRCNRTWRRSGPMWEGRFKSCLVDTSDYLVSCLQYIELNPVRAGMIADPGFYPWSSHLFNAYGEGASFMTPHPAYLRLGTGLDESRSVYRSLFAEPMADARIERIRAALWKELPLGDGSFLDRFESETGWKLPRGWKRVLPHREGAKQGLTPV